MKEKTNQSLTVSIVIMLCRKTWQIQLSIARASSNSEDADKERAGIQRP